MDIGVVRGAIKMQKNGQTLELLVTQTPTFILQLRVLTLLWNVQAIRRGVIAYSYIMRKKDVVDILIIMVILEAVTVKIQI